MLETMMARKEKVNDGIPSGLIGYYQDPNNPSRIAGFFGEVASKDFITATALHTAINAGPYGGVSTGEDEGWFKFYLDGKILYAPITPTWCNSNASGFGALMNRTITIRGKRYLVRYWGVLGPGITVATSDRDFKGSEAGRLFPNVTEPTSLTYPSIMEGETWARTSASRMNGKGRAWRLSSADSRFNVGGASYQLMWVVSGYVTGGTIGARDSANAWVPCLEQLD